MKRRTVPESLMLAAVLICCPARAAVYINCTDLGNGVIELSYDFSEEETRVRAFALDVRVSSGIILAVGDFSSHYWLYPGSLYIDGWGEHVDLGIPVVSSTYPGTLGGLGTAGMTTEMGAFWVGEANAPPSTGVLLTFIISGECDITVEGNAIRGGVVMEDPDYHPPVYMTGLQGALPPEPGVYGGGTGSPEDPFLIFDADQLNTIGAHPGDCHKHFKIMADIDLAEYTGTDFNVIGTSFGYAFRGLFDGNKHKISNFTYGPTDANFVGLFGYVDGSDAEIKDLDLVNPNTNAGTGDNVGSLVGYLRRGNISCCSAQGGTVSGDDCVGGLIGRNYIGIVENCYATSGVLGNSNLGGLAGRTYVEISNCYSTGAVWEYADLAGGLVGFNHGTISSSFWDEQTSGQLDGVGGTGGSATTDLTGEPTAQMQTKSMFTAAGWDFKGESANGTDDTWTICEGKTYPRLVRKGYVGDFVGSEAVDLGDFAVLAAAWKSKLGDANYSGICDISEPPDGVINEHDLSMFSASYLAGPP